MSIMIFLAVGGVGVIALVAANFTGLRWWWRIGAALIATLIITFAILTDATPTLGSEAAWFNRSPFRELILFVEMVFGMVARVLSVAIEHRNNVEFERRGSVKVDRWDFIYPMLFAVPTFGALLSQAGTEKLDVIIGTLAFQTGFFWQTILKKGDASLT
jgi:hypothetical protein